MTLPPDYEWPAKPDCMNCDGRGWYAVLDEFHPDGDLIDQRCPCWTEQAILNGPPE